MAKQLALPIDAKQFTQLPIDFYPFLKSPVEAFYLLILDNAQEKGFCDFSNSKLAKRMGCTDRSIKNWKKELQERGWIRIVNVKDGLLNKTSKIYPITPYPWRNSDTNSKSGVVNDRSLGVVNDRSPKNHIIDHISLSQTQSELERETSTEDKIHGNENKSSIPTIDDVVAYAIEQGYSDQQATDVAHQFVKFYEAAGWHDSKGNPVKFWQQKLLGWNYKPSRTAHNASKTVSEPAQELPKGNFDELFDDAMFRAGKATDSKSRRAFNLAQNHIRNQNMIFDNKDACKEYFDKIYAQLRGEFNE